MVQEYLAQHIIELYQKHAREWIELRGKFLSEKVWLDRFLALLPDSASILDLGCGSAQPIAAYFIAQGHQVTGVDASEYMIEIARQSFPEHVWVQQDFREYFPEQKFQGIVAWDSFFHLTQDDQRKMFKRFAEYAQSGTALMFSSGPEQGEAIGELGGEPLYHASLSTEEYHTLLQDHGFKLIKMIAEDVECTGHTIWLAQYR
ncbi:class I SAM-dependent methyltransferase [Acinetobacter vivianii]|uniref:class I SAM-dependent methyltransferase n=1 Tax=Acinetobacter vivianii TaxID=1776742 RepID=UPI002DB94BC0|nr:class I SAM-dependent methyltransferase [Acinetobacter vivianii]MEB6480112.1 class I SAM-dependent methyltransferase [Acinetobacter vivianii]MEB6658127.1 class I SAM-dependent methyltransferase [Acinetobacter vivianii]